ncbi:MAG: cytochrome P450 [Meiothermus sp.]
MNPTQAALKRPPSLADLSPLQQKKLGSFQGNPLEQFTYIAHTLGDVADISNPEWQAYLLSHPEHIEFVHVQTGRIFDKGYNEPATQALLGNGLVTSERDFWLRQRRMIQPAFHRERIAGYGKVMVEYAERWVAAWQDGETRDVHADMMAVTLEIILKSLFDTEVGQETESFGHAMDQALGGMAGMFSGDPTAQDRFGQAVGEINNFTARVIAERRKNPVDHGDLLSMLLAAQDEEGTGMSDEQLLDECKTLIMAGHETTSNTLSWAFYLLSRHPEVEAKLHAELDRVLGGRTPGMEDLRALEYTKLVIKETMRLLPAVWGVGRRAAQDSEIGGYFVPAGTDLQMSQWVVHRDPRWYENPLEFRPERWADGLEKRIPKYAYFPFGGGPRMCIGNNFALMEAPLILATVAQKYRLRVLEEPVLEPSITLRPKHGLKVRLERARRKAQKL